jgi:putative FmdB family regulatory protein
MPVYEYECKNPKESFEALQRISDVASDIRCPTCQADKPKRVLWLFSSASTKSTFTACSPGLFT